MESGQGTLFDQIEQLYKEHYTYLNNFLFKLTNDEKLTEDLIQETFLKVLRNPSQLQNVIYFRSWLITCGKNLLIDHKRKNNPTLLNDRDSIFNLLVDFNDPQVQLEFTETVKQELQDFSKFERTVFLLKEYYGYTYEEISELLDKPVNTLKSKIFRMKKTILSKGDYSGE